MGLRIRIIALIGTLISASACGDSGEGVDGGSDASAEGGMDGDTVCRSDRECSGDGLVCDRTIGRCVECRSDMDCGDGQACLSNECREATPCTSSRMCDGLVCDVDAGYCVECLSDVDCLGEDMCDDRVCVPPPRSCESDRQCSDIGLVCDTEAGHCVECIAPRDCPEDRYCSSDGTCLPDICSAGETRCASDTAIETCLDDGSGFGAPEDCAVGRRCRDGACVATDGGTMDASSDDDAGVDHDAGPLDGGSSGCSDGGAACIAGESDSCTTTCGSTGERTCSDTCTWGTCIPPIENCNGSDDDCDGAVDEGFACPQVFGDSGDDFPAGIAADSSGNLYLTGLFRQTIDFGGGPITSSGGSDVFVASFTPDGAHRWSLGFGSGNNDRARAIAVGSDDRVVIAGEFRGSMDPGGGTISSAGGTDVFVAAFSEAGAHLRSQRFGDSSNQRARGVTVDSANNVYLAGSFFGTVDFGSGALNADNQDVFLASLAPDGTHRWSMRAGASGNDVARMMATDGSDNVYVTGRFKNTIDFGGGDLTAGGGDSVFLAKFTSAGVHEWSRAFDDSKGWDVAVDGADNVYLTGVLSGTADFGGGSLTSAGRRDVLLASLAPSGTHRWSTRFGSVDSDHGLGVTLSSDDGLFLVGAFSSTVDFGGTSLTSASGHDGFVSRYSADGDLIWAQRFGGAVSGDDDPFNASTGDVGWSVATVGTDGVFAAGSFRGTADFDGSATRTSSGGADIVLWRRSQ